MTGRKRIAFVTESVGLGAITYSNAKFAERLLSDGHEVDFVAIDNVESAALQIFPKQIKYFELGADRVRKAPFRLHGYAKNRRPDVMVASCHLQCLITALTARTLQHRPRVLLRLHNATNVLLAAQKTFFDRKLLAPSLKFAAPAESTFVAVSDEAARDFERAARLPEQTVKTLHDPVLPTASRGLDPFSHAWLDDPETPTILAVGRLEPQKNYALLIKAFAIAHAERPELRLIILGDGSERPKLEMLVDRLGVRGAVTMPGFADPESAYVKASLFALSSRWEGLCNVLIEALAAGIRVVSTRHPVGTVEILGDGKYGMLVPPEDADALAKAILASLEGPVDRDALVGRALDFHIDRVWPTFAMLLGLDGDATG